MFGEGHQGKSQLTSTHIQLHSFSLLNNSWIWQGSYILVLSRAWPVHVSELWQAGAPVFPRRRSGWWPLTLPLEVLPLSHATIVQHSFWFFSFMWTTTSRGRKEASFPTPFTAFSEGQFAAWSARAPGPAERGVLPLSLCQVQLLWMLPPAQSSALHSMKHTFNMHPFDWIYIWIPPPHSQMTGGIKFLAPCSGLAQSHLL